jgi:hypothetical protein
MISMIQLRADTHSGFAILRRTTGEPYDDPEGARPHGPTSLVGGSPLVMASAKLARVKLAGQ